MAKGKKLILAVVFFFLMLLTTAFAENWLVGRVFDENAQEFLGGIECDNGIVAPGLSITSGSSTATWDCNLIDTETYPYYLLGDSSWGNDDITVTLEETTGTRDCAWWYSDSDNNYPNQGTTCNADITLRSTGNHLTFNVGSNPKVNWVIPWQNNLVRPMDPNIYTFTVSVSDPQGGDNIRTVYFAIAPDSFNTENQPCCCTHNFEQIMSPYFLAAWEDTKGYQLAVKSENPDPTVIECPWNPSWETTGSIKNLGGSAILLIDESTESISGNDKLISFTVNFTEAWTAGTYNLYVMVINKQDRFEVLSAYRRIGTFVYSDYCGEFREDQYDFETGVYGYGIWWNNKNLGDPQPADLIRSQSPTQVVIGTNSMKTVYTRGTNANDWYLVNAQVFSTPPANRQIKFYGDYFVEKAVGDARLSASISYFDHDEDVDGDGKKDYQYIPGYGTSVGLDVSMPEDGNDPVWRYFEVFAGDVPAVVDSTQAFFTLNGGPDNSENLIVYYDNLCYEVGEFCDVSQNACDQACANNKWVLSGEEAFHGGYTQAIIDADEESCCGDDGSAEFSKSRLCLDQAGNPASKFCDPDTNDVACCDDREDCVYNGKCYASLATYDLVGSGTKDAYCNYYASGKSRWIDCDYSLGRCNDCDSGAIGLPNCDDDECYVLAGESGVGEYADLTNKQCCGDDDGEYYIAIRIDGAPTANPRCCDNPSDVIDLNGDCVPDPCLPLDQSSCTSNTNCNWCDLCSADNKKEASGGGCRMTAVGCNYPTVCTSGECGAQCGVGYICEINTCVGDCPGCEYVDTVSSCQTDCTCSGAEDPDTLEDYCTTCSQNWMSTGSCCGDDVNEYFKFAGEDTGCVAPCILPDWIDPDPGASAQACCDEATDCVASDGSCVEEGELGSGFNPGGDDDTVLCDDGGWINCDTDETSCNLCGYPWVNNACCGDDDDGEIVNCKPIISSVIFTKNPLTFTFDVTVMDPSGFSNIKDVWFALAPFTDGDATGDRVAAGCDSDFENALKTTFGTDYSRGSSEYTVANQNVVVGTCVWSTPLASGTAGGMISNLPATATLNIENSAVTSTTGATPDLDTLTVSWSVDLDPSWNYNDVYNLYAMVQNNYGVYQSELVGQWEIWNNDFDMDPDLIENKATCEALNFAWVPALAPQNCCGDDSDEYVAYHTPQLYGGDIEYGCCERADQCLVDITKGISTLNDQPELFFSDPRPMCIGTGQFILDNYCDNGDWTTRTRNVAWQLLEKAEADNQIKDDYSLFCDTLDNAANYQDHILSNAKKVIDYINSCQPNCLNKLCVLADKNDHIRAFGSGFNPDYTNYQGFDLDELYEVLEYSGDCNGVTVGDSFQECDTDELWYNPVQQSFVYKSESGIARTLPTMDANNLLLYLTNYLDNIFTAVWLPSADLAIQKFVEQSHMYDTVYISKMGTHIIYARKETVKIAGDITTPNDDEYTEFLYVKYEGFTTNICDIVDKIEDNSCVMITESGDDNYYVSASREVDFKGVPVDSTDQGNLLFLSWKDLTAKLRVTP